MKKIELTPIGSVKNTGEEVAIQLEKAYAPGLEGLEGFSHVQVLWWCSELDSPEARAVLQTPKPYKTAPDVLGIFATRSPVRPNPIAVTVVDVLRIDYETGTIHLPYIDAFDGTPVLDIKPYTPSSDRVEAPATPAWCANWPKSLEEGGAFDWEAVFNF